MYTITYTAQFRKDVKRCSKRGYDISILNTVVDILQQTGTLPAEYRPHRLSSNHAGEWECHLRPDWLLVWSQNDTELTLLMLNTGTHSDIFG
ncbi:MAG: type II toxin-antitoxin system YafQ family toxin [Bacteroidales bacterium]|nr:type II toxin-antitoxin system YafQ family toxin [Bacteroidales bacterium]